MAQGTTLFRVQVSLSDVERGVYESLDLRLAQHPSEAMPYLVTRLVGYCLCLEDGIAFSKSGLATPDEPPVSVHGPDGSFLHWIDVGSPSAERLHRAAKAADKVSLFTTQKLALLRDSATAGRIHRASTIQVYTLEERWVGALANAFTRKCDLELTRTEQSLYASIGAQNFEGSILTEALLNEE